MHLGRTAAAAIALVLSVAVAAGCGSASRQKRPLRLEGNSIVLDDGRKVELRVWDASINCFRPLSTWAEPDLSKPERRANGSADLYLNVTIDRDCDTTSYR
jgi:hypothetical protein